MREPPAPLTPDELVRLDAEYRPFPSFADWPTSVPRASLWTRRLDDLAVLAAELPHEAMSRAIDVAIRAAAWDTGAIEGLYTTTRGLTMSVATQAAAWELEVPAHGDAAALFDAQLAAYELVLDVATQAQPVTQAWIRRLHEELTGPQETYTVHSPDGPREDPLPRGEYKRFPNHVELADGSRHAYAPVMDTQSEMERLASELTSDAFGSAHPVLQAAYAHYALVAVHPFADGNGRVARALASVYLYRSARLPLIVFYDDRPSYFDALAAADLGNASNFVRFVSDAAIGSVELVIESLRTAAAPSPYAVLDRFRDLVTVQGGLTHTDLDSVATTLIQHFQRILAEEIAKLTPPNGVQITIASGGGGSPAPPDRYRAVVAGGQYVVLQMGSAGPSQASRHATFYVFIARSRDEDADLFWIVQEGTGTGVRFALRDVHPLTSSAELRLRMLTERVLGIEVAALLEQAENSLLSSGYEDHLSIPKTETE